YSRNRADRSRTDRFEPYMKYRAPTNWKHVEVAELLEGSPRGAVVKDQFDFWATKPKSQAGVQEVFCAGDTSLLKKPCIAVIGSREVTEDGIRRARRIARELVE